jgi:hypothetical protein
MFYVLSAMFFVAKGQISVRAYDEASFRHFEIQGNPKAQYQ